MDAYKGMNFGDKLKDILIFMKFITLSLLGIFIYFIPITISGNRTILLDHLITAIIMNFPRFANITTLTMIIIGGLLPLYDNSWKKNFSAMVMSALRIVGLILSIIYFAKIGPLWLLRDDVLPLLIRKVVIPVALIIPLGSLFLTFLTRSGLLGFLGVLLKPIMVPVWKVPGLAAVNVVASFVGSFSVGIFMTNKLFKEGKYTRREAAIITTGFSTVSAAFMVVIAKNLDLMPLWNTFFWTTLLITFLVTAITARLKPLKSIEDVYIIKAKPHRGFHEGLIKRSIQEALSELRTGGPILKNIASNFKEGIIMSLRLLPLITAIGTISFVLVKMTSVFNVLAFIYYPITSLLRLPEAGMVAKASAAAIAEVLVPSIIMAEIQGSLAAKFAIGVVSISSVLFFSGSIPCILATDIDIDLKSLVIIHFQRTILTLIIVAPVIKLLF